MFNATDLRNRVLYDFGHGQVLNMDDIHDPILMKKLKKNLQEKPASDMTLDETMSLEHIRLHEEHAGHDVMHFKMIIIVVATLILAQFLLLFWKRCHYKSYQIASLVGLWLIPLVVSLRNRWWRFVSVWLFFSIVTSIIFKKSLQKPISRTVPRLVYHWFFGIHRVSYAAGVIGYTLLIASFFGANFYLTFLPDKYFEHSVMMVYYGLYFGVLGRDIAEICSDRMAAQMGYYSSNGMPTRALRRDVCAVCGNEMTCTAGNCMGAEKVYVLNCSHKFHEFCIRGWCIVGKKQTCPCCREKVDLQQIFKNPYQTRTKPRALIWNRKLVSGSNAWGVTCRTEAQELQRRENRNRWEKTHILYTQVLDFIRYIVSWQPLILSIAQIITSITGYNVHNFLKFQRSLYFSNRSKHKVFSVSDSMNRSSFDSPKPSVVVPSLTTAASAKTRNRNTI